MRHAGSELRCVWSKRCVPGLIKFASLTNIHSIEHHPNWYHDIPAMHTLILGSYPPHADRRHYEFYYPNKVNRFWNILAGIKGHTLGHFKGEDAVKERK